MDDACEAPRIGLVVGLFCALCVVVLSRPVLLVGAHVSKVGEGGVVWLSTCVVLLAAFVFFARQLNRRRSWLEQKQRESTYAREQAALRTVVAPCEGFFHLRRDDKQRQGPWSHPD
jgi:heme exporter protein D